MIHYDNKILVPPSLKEGVMSWYHDMLVHPGKDRMENSIRSLYSWQGLRNDVNHFCKTCDVCQRCKKTRKKKVKEVKNGDLKPQNGAHQAHNPRQNGEKIIWILKFKTFNKFMSIR